MATVCAIVKCFFVKKINMHSFKFSVFVCVVLILIFATDNEVTAAPHPCLWMLDNDHTQVTTPPTTAKPDLVEEFNKLKQKKTNQLEKLVTDWSK